MVHCVIDRKDSAARQPRPQQCRDFSGKRTISGTLPGLEHCLCLSGQKDKIVIEASLLPHSYIHRRLECFLGFNCQPFAARILRREVVNSSLPRGKAGGDPHPAALALAVSGEGAYVAAPIPKRAISGSDIVELYRQEEDAMLVVETATRAGASITDHDKPAERGLFMPLQAKHQRLFMPLQAKHQHPGAAAFHLY
jgi:hypothetical protein